MRRASSCWAETAGFTPTTRRWAPDLASEDRQLRPSPNAGRVRLARVGVVDFPVRPALDDLFERHPRLHARQRRSEAEVQPVAETEMGVAAMDVELLTVGIPALVPVS